MFSVETDRLLPFYLVRFVDLDNLPINKISALNNNLNDFLGFWVRNKSNMYSGMIS